MSFLRALLVMQPAGTALAQEIPFQLREGLIWVQVDVPQSSEPLNFLLDTGAGVSVLNSHTADRIGLKGGRPLTVQGVGASTVGHWPQPLSATASGFPLPKNYLVVDLTALSGACRCPIDGLIGADFIGPRPVQIDFASGKVRLLNCCSIAPGQDWLPLKFRHSTLRVSMRVNDGSSQWFRLDTGCASGLQWVTSEKLAQVNAPQLAVALGGIAIKQALTTVQMGTHLFEAVPTGLHDKAIFGSEAGLLGNGLLARFESVTIDTKGGRLLLGKRLDAGGFVTRNF